MNLTLIEAIVLVASGICTLVYTQGNTGPTMRALTMALAIATIVVACTLFLRAGL